MAPDSAITVFVVIAIAVVILAFLVLRYCQAPRAMTERLVMTVWSAYGPYDSAEKSADCLRRAACAVFGKEGAAKHEQWVEGHAENFTNWQVTGKFHWMQKTMCYWLQLYAYGPAFDAACKRFTEDAEAEVRKGVEWLNTYIEKAGGKLEAVKHPDGTTQVMYKQTWSDEEIERKERETGELLLNAIGNSLLKDPSPDAKQLLAFLGVVYQTNLGKNLLTPKQVGTIWVACLEVQDKNPNSEIATTFKVLNSAWNSNKCEIKTEHIELHLSKDAFTKAAIEKTAQDIERIFSSDEACKEFSGAKVIRKRGDEAIDEFRKHMLKEVQDIATSPNSFIETRKALVRSLECYIRNSMFFSKEFSDRREEIYQQLNASGAQFNDENVALGMMWADAESLFLRLLQRSMFEVVSQDDWWARYHPLYEEHVKSLYRAALAQAEGKVDSIHALMVKATVETTEKFKSQLFKSE